MKKILSVNKHENFNIRLFERTLFECCNHVILRFAVKELLQQNRSMNLYYKEITMELLPLCSNFGYRIDRMEKYIKDERCMNGFLFYLDGFGDPVGMLWYATQGANEFQYRVRNVDSFGFNFSVKQELRGKGIIGEMIKCIADKLDEEKIQYLYVSTRINNISALHAYEKVGAQKVKYKRFYRLLGIRIPYPKI